MLQAYTEAGCFTIRGLLELDQTRRSSIPTGSSAGDPALQTTRGIHTEEKKRHCWHLGLKTTLPGCGPLQRRNPTDPCVVFLRLTVWVQTCFTHIALHSYPPTREGSKCKGSVNSNNLMRGLQPVVQTRAHQPAFLHDAARHSGHKASHNAGIKTQRVAATASYESRVACCSVGVGGGAVTSSVQCTSPACLPTCMEEKHMLHDKRTGPAGLVGQAEQLWTGGKQAVQAYFPTP